MSPPSAHPGKLHRITRPNSSSSSPSPPLVAFEHLPHPSSKVPKHTLLFLPGLSDGLLTVPYTSSLAASLPEDWRFVESILGSSYRQWGFSSLDEDVTEIAQLVSYFRSLKEDETFPPGKGKVLLLGHSTGCQMIMHYFLSDPSNGYEAGKRPRIEGAIMQGSVSDREAMTMLIPTQEYERACETARQYVNHGQGRDVLPTSLTQKCFGKVPMTAERWLSLASPGPEHLGLDDYFSSDFDALRLERTFGKIGQMGIRTMFLLGERDQHVPHFVNRSELVRKWEGFVRKGGGVVDEGSGILLGGSHTLKEGGIVVDELLRRVSGLLERL
ncbi:MAG: hypothetical protein Q9163_003346 [Psora crenata]